MAGPKVSAEQSKLEDELRAMILGNVKLSDDRPARTQQSTYTPPHRQGRGLPRQPSHANGQIPPRANQQQSHRTDHRAPPPAQAVGGSPASLGDAARYTSPQQNRNHGGPPFRHRNGPTGNLPPSRTYMQPSQQRQTGEAVPHALNHVSNVLSPRVLQPPPPAQGANVPNARGSGQTMKPPHQTAHQGFWQNRRPPPGPPTLETFNAQCQYLDHVASIEIPKVEITIEELQEKESFRLRLERYGQEAFKAQHPDSTDRFALQCFGSISSGFATRGSDMDLAIVPLSSPTIDLMPLGRDLPRLLEKAFLDHGIGARLLTRTRVPIIKICEEPTPELFTALCQERQKWDDLPEEEKYAAAVPMTTEDAATKGEPPVEKKGTDSDHPVVEENASQQDRPQDGAQDGVRNGVSNGNEGGLEDESKKTGQQNTTKQPSAEGPSDAKPRAHGPPKPWLREKKLGPLDFPKSGVGIQCDINFSNPLALHNTLLLRCYSLCDPRVRPMILFVKAWAKRRLINSARNGTLSSYGYVLMVLHFLANIARPPVLPNLQIPIQGIWTPDTQHEMTVDGYNVQFWRDEEQIKRLAAQGQITANREPLGVLLRNFFNYYAAQGPNVIGHGFNWSTEVLSLRTSGGIRTKASKGWTGAKTSIVDNREVRHRYLCAIEDPFELDHNVARTVVHFGIVAIRDEFRRAWRILNAVGKGEQPEDELFAAVETTSAPEVGANPAPIRPEEARVVQTTGGETAEAAAVLERSPREEEVNDVTREESVVANLPG